MDRVLEKKPWAPWKVAVAGVGGLLAILLTYWMVSRFGGSRLNVELSRLTIATVAEQEFQESIPVHAQVLPLQTIYLDSSDGGRVDELYLEEGGELRVGESILRLTNPDLRLELMRREDQRVEQMNILRNIETTMAEERRDFQRRLAELDYEIVKARRIFERNAALAEAGLLADLEYQLSKDEYEFLARRREDELVNEAEVEESRRNKVRQAEEAVERMQANFEIAQERFDRLLITAPVAGQLTSLEVEVGEAIAPGDRLGQIDILDGFKARGQVDQHYLNRVETGQTAHYEADAEDYRLRVTKIYPEVADNKFEIDLDFDGDLPPGIRRGQNLSLKLQLSDPERAVVVPRGAFYQQTAGRWIYVLDSSGEFAVRREIRLGRQNTDYFEVLEGLGPEERVITSSYDSFVDVDMLRLER